jgi:hypothetical protein
MVVVVGRRMPAAKGRGDVDEGSICYGSGLVDRRQTTIVCRTPKEVSIF